MENNSIHPDKPIFEYDYIDDGIYIGTNQCCETHFNEELLSKGVTGDMSLEKKRIDAPFGADYYIWIPIKNHTAPTQEQLLFGVSTLDQLISMGKKVYVHCQFGHGRAPTMVAAYYIKKGKTVDEAIEFIKSKRPSIHIEDVQRKALEEFSKK